MPLEERSDRLHMRASPPARRRPRLAECLARVAAVLALTLTASFAQAQFVVPDGASFDVPPGASVDLACMDLEVQGAVSLTSGELVQTGTVSIDPGGSIDGGSGTLVLGGDWSNAGTFNAGTSTVVLGDDCATGPALLSGTTVFYNLTLTSTTGRNFVLAAGSNITVLGTLTLQGAAGQPISLTAASPPAVINLGPGAQVVTSNAVVAPGVFIGAPAAAAAIPTLAEYALLLLALLVPALGAASLRRHGLARLPA